MRTKRRLCLQAAALAALPVAWVPARAAAAPLSVALAPFLSPATLLGLYRPLREHLERQLARTVTLFTAKDFRTLAEDARRGEFEVVQLPAHLARLAMVDWRFEQLGGPVERTTVVVVVKAGGPVRSAADLRGRSIGMLDPLSLTATVGRRWLDEQGLAGAVNVSTVPSVNSALFALDRDEVAAFVAADTQLLALPAGTPRGDTVLARITDIPGPLFVARAGLPAAELAALREAMASFKPDPTRPETASNSLLRPLDAARLARLDALAAVARQALGPAR